MKKYLAVAVCFIIVVSSFGLDNFSGVFSVIRKTDNNDSYRIVDEVNIIPSSSFFNSRNTLKRTVYSVESIENRKSEIEFSSIDGQLYAAWKDNSNSAIYIVESISDFELKLTNIEQPEDVLFLNYDKAVNSFDYEEYYAFLESLESAEFKEKLHQLVKNHHYLGYDSARREMFGDVDNDNGYVDCVYTGKVVKTNGIPNSNIMNCEHTWPQSKFGGGESTSKKSDLYHLYPTDSKANSRRSSYNFGNVVNVKWSDGGSKLGTDKNRKTVFEPKDDHKGNVARSLFYFSVRYKIAIPDFEEEVLREWHELDPVDEEELMRNCQIEDLQRNRNPFIDNPHFVDMIENF